MVHREVDVPRGRKPTKACCSTRAPTLTGRAGLGEETALHRAGEGLGVGGAVALRTSGPVTRLVLPGRAILGSVHLEEGSANHGPRARSRPHELRMVSEF